MDKNVLVLDRNFMPLGMVDLKRGVGYLVKDKGYALHSSTISMGNTGDFAPSIVVLRREAAFERQKASRGKPLKWSKKGVLKRDGHVCAYCSGVATTVDHIHPKKKGGKNTWMNTIAACLVCNGKKDCLTLEEAGMKLLFQPFVPDNVMRRMSVTEEQRTFLIENSMTNVLM